MFSKCPEKYKEISTTQQILPLEAAGIKDSMQAVCSRDEVTNADTDTGDDSVVGRCRAIDTP